MGRRGPYRDATDGARSTLVVDLCGGIGGFRLDQIVEELFKYSWRVSVFQDHRQDVLLDESGERSSLGGVSIAAR